MGRRPRARADPGQASVELALILPLVLGLLLVVVQVGLVVRDDILVVHAAREAARAAAVGEDDSQVRQAALRAGPLAADRLRVTVTRRGGSGGQVVVVVGYRSVTELPLIGALAPDVDLSARVVMRQE
jgi:Flp pilus assembly protein TadG